MAESKTSEMIEILINHENFTVIDIETTGFTPKKGSEIIEIGAYKWHGGKSGQRFHEMVKPAKTKKLPKDIKELTHITDEELKDAPYLENVMKKLKDFVADDVLVFHNAAFDWTRFIKPAFENIGYVPTNPCICTLLISKKIMPDMGYRNKSYKLCDLCQFFGYDMSKGSAHRADFDAMCTAALLKKIKEFVGTQTLLTMPVTQKKTKSWDCEKIIRVKPWKKKKLERLYISTTLGDIYYDYGKGIWTVQRLISDRFNLDMKHWENFLVRFLQIEDLGSWLEDQRPIEKEKNR